MAAKIDDLTAAWRDAGEVLARVDRARMVALLEIAEQVAAAHGAPVEPIRARWSTTMDLDASAELC